MGTQSGTYSYFEKIRDESDKTKSTDFFATGGNVMYTEDLYNSDFDQILENLKINTQNKIRSTDVRNLAYTLYVNDYKGGIRVGTSKMRDSLNERFREWGMMFYVLENGVENRTLWILEPNSSVSIDDNTFKIAATPANSKWREVNIVGGGASMSYTNLNKVPYDLGGIVAGQSFSNVPYQDMFDMLLYPDVDGTISLTGGGMKEFGDFSPMSFTYKSIKNTHPLTSESLSGYDVPPISTNSNGQTLTFTSSGTHSMGTTNNSVTNSYTATIAFDGKTKTSSASITFRNRIHYGSYKFNGINDPIEVGDYGNILSQLTDEVIKDLHLGRNGSDVLTTSYKGIFTDIGPQTELNEGEGENIVFAYPSSFVGTPVFEIGGFNIDGVIIYIGDVNYTNPHGYTREYKVYVKRNAEHSWVDKIEIK